MRKTNAAFTAFFARAANGVCLAAAAAVAVAFACVSAGSLLTTCVLDPERYWGEHILFLPDSVAVNAAVLLGSVLLLLGCRRALSRVLKRVSVPAAAAVLLFIVLAAGTLWVASVRPEVSADSRMILRVSQDFIRGDFSALTTYDSNYGTYFHQYRFQLGAALFYECAQRLIGVGHYTALAEINVVCLAAAYAAVIFLTNQIFNDRRVTLIAIALLGLFFQGILYCTLLYGTLPGYALAAWAVALTAFHLRTGRRWPLIPAAVLCAAAAALKPNYWIFVIAIAAMLMLHALAAKKWPPLLAAALVLLLSVCGQKLVAAQYEWRADAKLGPAAPATLWLMQGITESDRAPGWYKELPYSFRPEAAAASAGRLEADIRARIAQFRASPAYARYFFGRKIMSQWDEPTFQSIWVSRIKKSDDTVPPVVAGIYYGAAGRALETYFKYQVQFIHCLFTAGAVLALVRRKRDFPGESGLRPAALLLLLVLGAFCYHAIAEAKSQYVLIYIPLMLPFAAYAIQLLTAPRFLRQ